MNVAIIGASSNREKYGNKAVRSYHSQGHTVFPVNPNEAEIEGLKAYKAVTDIPETVDRALMYVPPSVGINTLAGLAQKGIRDVYVNPGAGSDKLMEEGERLGLNMVEACAILAIGDTPGRYR